MLTAISMSAIATNGVVPGNNLNLLILCVDTVYFFLKMTCLLTFSKETVQYQYKQYEM